MKKTVMGAFVRFTITLTFVNGQPNQLRILTIPLYRDATIPVYQINRY